MQDRAIEPNYSPARIALMALAPFGLGYFFSYLFRAVNAVVAPDLVSELQLNASDLGLLTAAYLLAFSLCQFPLGILLDRYGPRRVQFGLLMLAALGAGLFSVAHSTLTLSLARGLIGTGVAGGLMAGFKAVVLWVPAERRALANSFVMSMGAIGLLVSTAPMEWAVRHYGWRSAFLVLGAATAVVATIILIVVPERRAAIAQDTLGASLKAVGGIYRDRAFWLITPLLCATAGTHIAIQTLWAAPWLRDVAGYDRQQVANVLFLMAGAFFVGILTSGGIADWLQRRGVNILDVMLGFLAAFMLSQLVIVLDIVPLRLPAWLMFGLSGQVAILAYPWLSTHFGAHLAGRSNTAVNLLLFMTAFLIQYAIGRLLDLYPRTASGGYPVDAYTFAFGVFLALQVAALLIYLGARRRHFVRPSQDKA
ncbi:MAG: MFS transporter [Hyphomicrobiaceae bacterium]|nr:MFS transporter [Hyphomicrobiaceae bacterium]